MRNEEICVFSSWQWDFYLKEELIKKEEKKRDRKGETETWFYNLIRETGKLKVRSRYLFL